MTFTGKEVNDGKTASAQAGVDRATAYKALPALPLVDGTEYSITKVVGRLRGMIEYEVTPVDEDDDGIRFEPLPASLTEEDWDAAPEAVKDWLIARVEANGKWT